MRPEDGIEDSKSGPRSVAREKERPLFISSLEVKARQLLGVSWVIRYRLADSIIDY